MWKPLKIAPSVLISGALLGGPAPLAAQAEESAARDSERAVVRALAMKVPCDAEGEDYEVLDEQVILLHEKGEGELGTAKLPYLHFKGHKRYIGVQLMDLTPDLRQHFGVPAERGVLVSRVLPGTPAEKAGVSVGDIIATADDKEIQSVGDLARVVRGTEIDHEIDLELWREGRKLQLRVGIEDGTRQLVDLTAQLGAISAEGALEPPEVEVEMGSQVAPTALRILPLERYTELEQTLEHLDDYFESEDWQERLQRIEAMDWKAVESRMKEVEKRLRELEAELEQEEPDN